MIDFYYHLDLKIEDPKRKNNKIATAIYNKYNFIPKNLFM